MALFAAQDYFRVADSQTASDAVVKDYLNDTKGYEPLATLTVDVEEGIRQELDNKPGVLYSALACLWCPFSLGLCLPSNCSGKAQSYTREAFTSFAAALKVELLEDYLVVEITQPYTYPMVVYTNQCNQPKWGSKHCCFILPHCFFDGNWQSTPRLRVIRLRDLTKVESVVRNNTPPEPCCGTPTNHGDLKELHSHIIISSKPSPWGNHSKPNDKHRVPMSVTIFNGKDVEAFAQAVRRQKKVSCAKSESATALPQNVLEKARNANSFWDVAAYTASLNAEQQLASTEQHVVNIEAPDAVVAPQQVEFERMDKPTAPAVATVLSPLAGRLKELANLHKEGILSDDEYTNAKAKAIENLS
eukprot:g7499.t1